MNENIKNEPNPGGSQQPFAGAAQGTKETVKETAREARDTMRETARQTKDTLRVKAGEVKSKVSELGAKVKEHGQDYVDDQKARTADRIEGYSDTVREASERMKREQDPNIAHYTRLMADKLDQAAQYVRNCEVNDLRREAEILARNHPAVFFGGMFVAGLAIARFVKASAEHTTDSDRAELSTDPQSWSEQGEFTGTAASPSHSSTAV